MDLLAEKERRRKADPLKYAKKHPKQQEATDSDKAIRALFWGNRVGKTEWGAQEVAAYLLDRHPHRDVGPPIEIWSGCPSFDLQLETTQKKLMHYLPEDAIARKTKLRGEILKDIRMKNGNLITFKSYEQGREKWQGAGKRLIWFDEEPPYDIWEEAFVRQEAGVDLDIILTMTAIKGMTWVYEKLYLATNNPDIFISEAGWDDNPWLLDKQKDQMSRGLSPEAIKVRKEGKFVKRVGLVCGWWSRSHHVKHYGALDPSWGWYEVIDGGFSDPSAYLLIGIDFDGNVHVVKGFREPNLLTSEIKSRRDALVGGLTITSGFSDNDNPRLNEELSLLGMKLQAIEKRSGESKSWDEVLAEKLAEYGKIQRGINEPKLFISDSLVRFDEKIGETTNWMIQELENLSWVEIKSKEGYEVKPKWDDHRRFGHHFDGVRALAYFLISYLRTFDRSSYINYAKRNRQIKDFDLGI